MQEDIVLLRVRVRGRVRCRKISYCLGLGFANPSPTPNPNPNPHPNQVRHSALLLFSQLLLEDYLKWRPSLFRAFCAALADVEPGVRAAAQVCLVAPRLPLEPEP